MTATGSTYSNYQDIQENYRLDNKGVDVSALMASDDIDASPLVPAGQNSGSSQAVQSTVRVSLGTSTFTLLLKYLAFNPLVIGCYAFFILNGTKKAGIEELKKGFKPRWGRNCLAMFLRGLFEALWTLLFIIPGVVKSYAYRMVPFICAEDEDIDPVDAIKKSQEMMKGHKWEAFVLDLSFIGWHILGVLTLGILEVFYIMPYQYQTNAELYRALKGPEEDDTVEVVEAYA